MKKIHNFGSDFQNFPGLARQTPENFENLVKQEMDTCTLFLEKIPRYGYRYKFLEKLPLNMGNNVSWAAGSTLPIDPYLRTGLPPNYIN